MKLQRSTGVLLGVAIALVATVAIIETTQKNRPQSGDALYNFAESDVDAFTITRQDTTLAFEKTDDTWQMTEPEAAPAEPSAIAFLLNIITTDPIKETVVVNADRLDDYGLEDPRATIELTVADMTYSLALGDEDFSGSSLYVMTTDIAPESKTGELYLMPKTLQSGIGRRVDEWIATEVEENETGNPPEESLEPESENTPEETDTQESADSPNESPDADNESEATDAEDTEEEAAELENEDTPEESDAEDPNSPESLDTSDE